MIPPDVLALALGLIFGVILARLAMASRGWLETSYRRGSRR